jgi:hypothetical protein
VRVDEAELRNSSTRSACQTEAEVEAEETRRAAALLASEEKRLKGNVVKQMVEAGTARLLEQAERAERAAEIASNQAAVAEALERKRKSEFESSIDEFEMPAISKRESDKRSKREKKS